MKRILNSAGARCLLLTTASIAFASAQASDERRQLGSHEHGVTVLNIALEDTSLVIEMKAPAVNVVGFEHPPGTDEQKQAIADALAKLQGDALFAMPAGSGCQLESAEAKHIVEAADDDHDDHDDHDEGDKAKATHSEFTALYSFKCAAPGRLDDVSVALFEQFPLTTEIEASFIGPEVQTFAELTPSNPVLRVRR
jgi:hypothetical protein